MHEPWMEEDLPFPLFQRFLSNDESLSFCEPRGDCEMCTATQLNAQDECKATSRIQLFSCRAEKEDSADIVQFRSCVRTATDEEFLVIRLQVMCFLLGSISLFMVRRQKRSTTTLFDQRKANIGAIRRNASLTDSEDLEMVDQQDSGPNEGAIEGDEFAPLTIGTPSKSKTINVV